MLSLDVRHMPCSPSNECKTLPAGAPRKITGLNSSDAVFRETRDRFYVGARRWLNETLR